MNTVPARDLRNHTAAVLRRVAAGERVEVTVHGETVAEIGPPAARKSAFLSRSRLLEVLRTDAADAGLREDLRSLDASTDELGPIV